MTDDLYYRKMESTSTTDLVDMIRERDERIAELENENLKRGYHYEVEVINGRPTGKAILVFNLEYAKSIVRDLLNNSDEYAKQRARVFLEENLK